MLWTRPNYYDLLKAIAILLMIVDHIGFFFFPEFTLLRVIGRISMPLFLFLVGYNRSGNIRRWFVVSLLLVDGALFGYDMIMGYHFVGSILWSILCVKLIHHGIKEYRPSSSLIVWWGSFLSLILLYFNSFSSQLLDYGTLAISIGLCWLLVWTSQTKTEKTISYLTLFVVMLVYFVEQIEVFSIGSYIPLLSLLAIVWTWLITGLSTIHHTYKGWLGKIILRLSKYSLRIYMGHVCLFACIAYLIAYYAK